MKNVNYEKTKTTLQQLLTEKIAEAKALRNEDNIISFSDALYAMDFAEKYHVGMRKCGITPVFQHQISIALYINTIEKSLENPALCYILAFLHDTYEDVDRIYKATGKNVIEALENDEVLSKYLPDIKRMSKYLWTTEVNTNNSTELVLKREDKSLTHYFDDMANCPSASVVKCSDRIHNLATMVGVFSQSKMRLYANEVPTYFLPMLKSAKHKHKAQIHAYENLKSLLSIQYETVIGLLDVCEIKPLK